MITLTKIFKIHERINDIVEIKKEICGNVAITRVEKKNVSINNKTGVISIDEKSFQKRKNFFTKIRG